MWIDALLAYAHFTAAFVLFAFLSIEVYLVRGRIDPARALELRRSDAWYWGAMAAVIATGIARLYLGAKGAAFHTQAWPLYVKLALLAATIAFSLRPAAAFRRWMKPAQADARWIAPDAERIAVRRHLMAAIHVAALIPLAAVLMARGLG